MFVVHKEFLSQEENGGGSVSFFLERYRDDTYTYGSITVTDCDRKTELSFSFVTDRQYKVSLNKINNFISVLEKFREEFIKAAPKKSTLKYC